MGKNTISFKVTVNKTVADYLEEHPLESFSKVTNTLWMIYLENPDLINKYTKKQIIGLFEGFADKSE
jgi:hypothetical protein